MTRTISDLQMEIDEGDMLMTRCISQGIDGFVSSLYDRAVVDWRMYRIAEWSRQLSDYDRQQVPSVDWRSLQRLRTRLAHRFHTIDPVLMFVFAAMDVPKMQFALHALVKP